MRHQDIKETEAAGLFFCHPGACSTRRKTPVAAPSAVERRPTSHDPLFNDADEQQVRRSRSQNSVGPWAERRRLRGSSPMWTKQWLGRCQNNSIAKIPMSKAPNADTGPCDELATYSRVDLSLLMCSWDGRQHPARDPIPA